MWPQRKTKPGFRAGAFNPALAETEPADKTLAYTKIVEKYAHFFDRPEARLRFLHNTLAQQAASREKADAALARFGGLRPLKGSKLYEQLLDLWFYHLIFQELKKHLPSASRWRRSLLGFGKAPFTARLLFSCYQHRYAVGVLGFAALTFFLFNAASWSKTRLNAYLAERYRTERRVEVAGGGNPLLAEANARHLPDYRPEKVWPVEQNESFERYSNGARILNDYATENHPRAFYVVPRESLLVKTAAAPAEPLRRDPVGIVYHTSEGHLVPFTSDHSEQIESRTRGLLEYVRKNRSYNYVIDRFGQIYRVVRDDHAANHAGNSVWADGEGVYVGLNESFLGVCFETTMEAGSSEERLTEAQMVSGRLLTQVLRSRYQISDANCVAHGLVSVNPKTSLICFHHDWARDFPFAAMGLSDKYKVAPASVGLFGFTYDEEVTAKLGGAVWPGVIEAEDEFKRRAEAAGAGVEDLRRRLRERYREHMDLQRRLRGGDDSDAD